jgi:hypothetical protein
MKMLSLALLALLSACASHTWTEQTDVWRSAEPGVESIRTVPVEDFWIQVAGTREDDGYQLVEMLRTGPGGDASFSLLPAALQALAYDGEVVLEFRSLDGDRLVHTSRVSVEGAQEILAQWRVQVRLGARPRLRPAEQRLIVRILEEAQDAEVLAALREIRPAVSTRMDWE